MNYLSTRRFIRRGDIEQVKILNDYRHYDAKNKQLLNVCVVPGAGRVMIPLNTENAVRLATDSRWRERFFCLVINPTPGSCSSLLFESVLQCVDAGIKITNRDECPYWFDFNKEKFESAEPTVQPQKSAFQEFSRFIDAHLFASYEEDHRSAPYFCLLERPDCYDAFDHVKEQKLVTSENGMMGDGLGGPLMLVHFPLVDAMSAASIGKKSLSSSTIESGDAMSSSSHRQESYSGYTIQSGEVLSPSGKTIFKRDNGSEFDEDSHGGDTFDSGVNSNNMTDPSDSESIDDNTGDESKSDDESESTSNGDHDSDDEVEVLSNAEVPTIHRRRRDRLEEDGHESIEGLLQERRRQRRRRGRNLAEEAFSDEDVEIVKQISDGENSSSDDSI